MQANYKTTYLILGTFLILLCGKSAFLNIKKNTTDAQTIYAQLVTWGICVDHLSPDVPQSQIDQQIALLSHHHSETSVAAAHWLAARGVKQATAEIATAIQDKKTFRPCQLAHALGELGDTTHNQLLMTLASQTKNKDLSVCATMALGTICAPETTPHLIARYEKSNTSLSILTAICNIASPTAIPFLTDLVNTTQSQLQKQIAKEGILRINILTNKNPIKQLIAHLTTQANADANLSTWHIRQLAIKPSEAGATSLYQLLNDGKHRREVAIALTAALLAHGNMGVRLLNTVSQTPNNQHQTLAQAALSL